MTTTFPQSNDPLKFLHSTEGWDAAFRAHSCSRENEETIGGGNGEHQWKVYRGSEVQSFSRHVGNSDLLGGLLSRQEVQFIRCRFARVRSDGSGDFAAAVGQMCSFPLGIPTAAPNAMTHLAQIKGMVWAVL
jgi:hypothetical protein